MRLVAFGIGYVGLVSGTGLPEPAHEVLCVDIDPKRIHQGIGVPSPMTSDTGVWPATR
jgi:UDP-glucose 6-dehydrogenase